MMLQCDGYKMFRGNATVTPCNGKPPFTIYGTWLYRPDVGCWYCQEDGDMARGYPPDVVSNFQVDNGRK